MKMFELRGDMLDSRVSGKLWRLECRLVGPMFLFQGVRVLAQKKPHHTDSPRTAWGWGGVIGRLLDDAFIISCHWGKT